MRHIKDNKIVTMLVDMWFKKNYIEVYLAVIHLWRASIVEISKNSAVPRPTVHNIVKDFITKGLLVEIVNGRKREIILWGSTARENELQKKRVLLNNAEKSVYDFLPFLDSLKNDLPMIPNVRSYEGVDGMKVMLQEVVKDWEDMLVLSDNKKFSDKLPIDFIRKSYLKRSRMWIVTKMIFSEGFDDIWYGDKQDYKVEIKTINQDNILNWALNLWWNKVALHSYRNNAYSTVIIESQEIARVIRFMRAIIRKSARPT